MICPYCQATLLFSDDRGPHCDNCDQFDDPPIPVKHPNTSTPDIWIVCQWKQAEPSPRLEFQGVYDSEAAAVAQCKDECYFVQPMALNEALPHETMPVTAYYPITKKP